MIHIKLHDRRTIGPGDPMGREWVGYDSSLSDAELFEQNRGRWVLGARADREEYALFSYIGDHTVKFVAAIDGFEDVDRKRAIVGRVVGSGHPVARRWVGTPAPDRFRNPATYFDESEGPKLCACGCGDSVPVNRAFVPGHDQKAIHERITRQWGGTLGFIAWFDEVFAE